MFLQIVIGKTCICFLQVIVEKKYLYRRKEKLRPVLELQVKLFNFRPFPEQWKYCCAIPFVRSRDDQNTYLLSNLINLELEVHLCERYLISIMDTRSSSSTQVRTRGVKGCAKRIGKAMGDKTSPVSPSCGCRKREEGNKEGLQ